MGESEKLSSFVARRMLHRPIETIALIRDVDYCRVCRDAEGI